MREIEFRGKSKRTGKWVFGTGIVQIEENTYDTNKWEIVQKVNYDELDYFIPSYETEEIDINTLGQYTGLKDKNGKKIFEGDIVLYEDWTYEDGESDSYINKGVVEYNESNCCFNITGRNTVDIADVLYEDNEDLEIIGNIYDNSELLKEKL